MDTDDSPAPFGDWLRDRLRAREMTAADLARAMDVRPGTISRWLRNRRPEFDYCERIADALLLRTEEVLKAAGYLEGEADDQSLDDPVEQLVAKVRRVNWTDDRLGIFEKSLDSMIEFDRRRKQEGRN